MSEASRSLNPVRGRSFSQIWTCIVSECSTGAAFIVVFLGLMIPLHCIYGGVVFFSEEFDVGWFLSEPQVMLGSYTDWLGAVALAAMFVLQYWLTASLIRQKFWPGWDRFLPWLGMLVLSSLLIGMGFVLFLIPGAILMVRFVPLLPLVTVRDEAGDMLAESMDITQGNSLVLFLVAIAINMPYLLLLVLAQGFSLVINDEVYPLDWIATGVVHSTFAAINTAFSVAAYRLLAEITDQAQEVFA